MRKFNIILLIMALSVMKGWAQFSLTGQLRTRTEYRNGWGSPVAESAKPGIFTSQRTRLNFGYAGYRFKLYSSLQDVRVWGQDQSTVNRNSNETKNGLMLHEAWAEISLLDTAQTRKGTELSLKIGRQELVYDDVRFLGNLDWLQQARRHDAALLKYAGKAWTVHAGAAFNQNGESETSTVYNGVPTGGNTPGTNGIGLMYKSMQFVYVKKKLSFGYASFLSFKDDFNKTTKDQNGVVTNVTGVNSRITSGLYLTGTSGKINFTLSGYLQNGRNKSGQNLNAYFYTAQGNYKAGKKLSLGLGYDYTSGNKTQGTITTDHKFDPLYGTPHKFWGNMDYFYVAKGFGQTGLSDFYFKSVYKPADKWLINFDIHQFNATTPVFMAESTTPLSKNFGQEYDLVASYTLTKIISFEAGYSVFNTSETLSSPSVKNIADAQKVATWGYLTLNIKPDFMAK